MASIKELNGKVKSLEKDKKELRDQLNKHAAMQFRSEFDVCWSMWDLMCGVGFTATNSL